MASVRTEEIAFSDLRFEVLAQLASLADADHARGKMNRLWRQCTIDQAYVLSAAVVRSVLGPNGVEAIIDSQLGEQVDDGIRIKGTKGRIEWLGKVRKNGRFGKRGGRPKKNPRGLSKQGVRVSENTPQETLSTSVSVSTSTQIQDHENINTQTQTLALVAAADVELSRVNAVQVVCDYYRDKYPKRVAQTKNAETRRKIKARLAQGYTAEQLCRAIDGNAKSQFHREGNYHDLELCVRDEKHVDRFLVEFEQQERAGPTGFITRKGREIQAAVASAMADPNMFDP
jgi:hypothetical protein